MLEDVVQLWIVPSAGLKQSILLFTDMREASRRLSQSLFDVYESDWAGEEDLGAIVEVSAPKKKNYCSTFQFHKCKNSKNACITRGTKPPHFPPPCYA